MGIWLILDDVLHTTEYLFLQNTTRSGEIMHGNGFFTSFCALREPHSQYVTHNEFLNYKIFK